MTKKSITEAQLNKNSKKQTKTSSSSLIKFVPFKARPQRVENLHSANYSMISTDRKEKESLQVSQNTISNQGRVSQISQNKNLESIIQPLELSVVTENIASANPFYEQYYFYVQPPTEKYLNRIYLKPTPMK